MQTKDTNMVSIISAFVLGGLLGAGVALLMAPQSGEKTRSLLMDKSAELKDMAMGTADDTRSRASKAIDNLTQTTKDRAGMLSKRGRKMMKNQPSMKERVQAVICE